MRMDRRAGERYFYGYDAGRGREPVMRPTPGRGHWAGLCLWLNKAAFSLRAVLHRRAKLRSYTPDVRDR